VLTLYKDGTNIEKLKEALNSVISKKAASTGIATGNGW
jgi:hypothetical protein